jgi:hypothetical protein
VWKSVSQAVALWGDVVTRRRRGFAREVLAVGAVELGLLGDGDDRFDVVVVGAADDVASLKGTRQPAEPRRPLEVCPTSDVCGLNRTVRRRPASPLASRCLGLFLDHVKERANFEILEVGVSKVSFAVDGVPVPSSQLDLGHVALGDKVAEDALGSTLSDPDAFGNVTGASVRISSDAEEHIGVVGQKDPRCRCCRQIRH